MRLQLSNSQKDLLDIVFERVHLSFPEHEVIPDDEVTISTLQLMSTLSKIEFNSSLQKELKNTDEGRISTTQPHPFDVFLVEPTFRNRNIHIAVAVPIKNSEHGPILNWYDKNDNLWPLDQLHATRKLTSLSGTARVLENLKVENVPFLMRQAMKRKGILDASAMNHLGSLSLVSDSSELNKSQQQALAMVMNPSFQEGFVVIQGPPGTGKTQTLSRMIEQTGYGSMVCAPSNAAIANIALKLISLPTMHIFDICIYGKNCEKSVQFLNPSLRREQYNILVKQMDIETSETQMAVLKANFCRWLRIDVNSPFEVVRSICASSDEFYYSSCKTICCTLNSSASPWIRSNGGERSILFLDEAGQCNEAEFYIATAFPNIEKVVLVGDPKQLPPTTLDLRCMKAGLGKSWLERIYDLSPKSIHLLDTQYRMDPSILEFPNQHFYNNRIKSDVSVRSRSPAISNPIGFIDTSGRTLEEKDGFSTMNVEEAYLIRALFRQDNDIKSLLGIEHTTVVVITPYSAQQNLLQNELKKVKFLKNLSVSTVDSYQGQEADVVVISTVRTNKIGFVDDPQRLNVALTRAKRLVRVVGCKDLFISLKRYSPLKHLALFLSSNNTVVKVDVLNSIFSMPDWNASMFWKPSFTQRFHNSMGKMTRKEKAIVLNTLHAISVPHLKKLQTRPSNAYWQKSCLKGHEEYYVVWIAKSDYVIEAHLAGSRNDCLQFIQKYFGRLPRGACKVEKDLCGIREHCDHSHKVLPAWDLNNLIQRAIANNNVTELPNGVFHLDKEQQEIVQTPPPLLIESRSGTGKTNVLFQHALTISRELVQDPTSSPIGFVTVSKMLQAQLENMFQGIKALHDTSLHSCVFMSLFDLLDGLAERLNLDMHTSKATSYKEYNFCKKSHSSISQIDTRLIENEIGGVISGSLKCAHLCRALKLQEYIEDQRSNVGKDHEYDVALRETIYNHYKSYDTWKKDSHRYDVNDMVLEILQKLRSNKISNTQLFSAVYLDEVQDFSYSMIYLICSIGGKNRLRWVFAGDTAQMVSPGSSFKFAGLKQTLLSLNPGIETQLKDVAHLLVNYRTTVDVLELGNSILSKAKQFFPGAIEFAKKEKAVNDFGLKVIVMNWEAATDETNPSFGKDQALIYSFDRDEEQNLSTIRKWLGDHPFILSVLDSKGLEFDDVVVAFALDRKSWKIEKQTFSALSMLRELYVAVTRAKRRVIILMKKRSDTMKDFFANLNYEVEYCDDSSPLVKEFNTCSTKEQWLQRANDLFQEERFLLASRCYEKATNIELSIYSHAKHLSKERMYDKALKKYIYASDLFHRVKDFAKILDIAAEILDNVSWESQLFIKDEVFATALGAYPNYLNPETRQKIDIYRDQWRHMTVRDLITHKAYVNKRRGSQALMEFLQENLPASDVIFAESCPCIVGDMFFNQELYLQAVGMYLKGGDSQRAEDASLKVVQLLRKIREPVDLFHLKKVWEPFMTQRVNKTLRLLFLLFNDTEKAAQDYSKPCMEFLGENAVRYLIVAQDKERTLLHNFSKQKFHDDVLNELQKTFEGDHIQIVRWFDTHNDINNAHEYMLKHITELSIDALTSLLDKDYLLCALATEFARREYYYRATMLFKKCRNLQAMLHSADKSLSTRKDAEMYAMKIMKEVLGIVSFRELSPRLKLLAELFKSPSTMDKERCKESMKTFGAKVVQEFVLRRTEYSTPKRGHGQQGPQYEYVDVIDVLSKVRL